MSPKYHSPQLILIVFEIFKYKSWHRHWPMGIILILSQLFWSTVRESQSLNIPLCLFLVVVSLRTIRFLGDNHNHPCRYFRKTLYIIFLVGAMFHLLVLLHFSQASRKKIREELMAEQRGLSESEDGALGWAEAWRTLRRLLADPTLDRTRDEDRNDYDDQ